MSEIGAVGGIGASAGPTGLSSSGPVSSPGGEAVGTTGATENSGPVKEAGGPKDGNDANRAIGVNKDTSNHHHFAHTRNINMSTQEHIELRNTFHHNVNCEHNMDMQKLIEMMMALQLLKELNKNA